MTTPYKATIKGQEREITGMDADGNYVFTDGEKLACVPFAGTILRKDTLMKVSELRFRDDHWFVDGEDLIYYYARTLLNWRSSTEAHTEKRTIEALKLALEGLSSGDREKVCGVAWFYERFEPINARDAVLPTTMKYQVGDDSSEGGFFGNQAEPFAKVFAPFLLSDFGAVAQSVSHRSKTRNLPEAKSVARFESDYSVAVLPQRGRDDKAMTIETELRGLIKTIIGAGGRVPRTKLRDGKSDTYQPEKLLASKVAKALVKANLLGTEKSGRTTIFWAKSTPA